jgi:hypothetical protein
MMESAASRVLSAESAETAALSTQYSGLIVN